MKTLASALIALSLAVSLAACSGGGASIGPGGSPGSGGSPPTQSPGGSTPTTSPTNAPQGMPAPTAPPDAAGVTNTVPTVPASGCRQGGQYDISVQSGPTDISPTGAVEVFTVFEPAQLCAGQTYPLIFNGPGFGGARDTTASDFSSFLSNGYGVISVDEAGEGNDGGKIRVMDPDQEGQMLLAVMNWAQAKLTWLAYGPTNDGTDPHEPIYGSDGGSYGGMYQFMLLNIDTRHRLRAIAPDITPNDLNYSLFPGGAIKTLWDFELFAVGQSAGNGTSRANFDPYVNNTFASDLAANAEDSYAHDFFGYHSVDYFCNGTGILTNGGAGTIPHLAPTTKPPKINALVMIGVRDTLFNYNNGYNNYKCMQRGGGDVRFLSHQAGHNSQVNQNVPLGSVPDPYVAVYYPSGDSLDNKCGNLDMSAAELAWFNQYLKGQAGAASMVPTGPCISFSAGDGITLPTVPTYTSGPAETPFDVGSVNLTSGTPLDVPTTVTLYTAPAGGAVIAGIPHVVYDVAATAGVSVGTPIIYVGYGVKHVSNAASWDLVDNMVMPLRGIGHFDEDIPGGGVRLQPGDQVAALFFGLNSQFAGNGSINIVSPTVEPLTVSGKLYLPILPNIPANI